MTATRTIGITRPRTIGVESIALLKGELPKRIANSRRLSLIFFYLLAVNELLDCVGESRKDRTVLREHNGHKFLIVLAVGVR